MSEMSLSDTIIDDDFWGRIRPVSTVPRRRFEIRRFVKGKNGFAADEEFRTNIEGRINEFFLDRRMELLPNFKSLSIWQNFEYMVALVDPTKNDSNGKFNYDSLVGLLLAFTIWTRSIGKVRLYGVIGIAEEYRGNGHLNDLIRTARNIDLTIPAGLRTSSPYADVRYTTHSDYRVPTNVKSDGHGDGSYIAHLFGFKDPFTREPIKDYSNGINAVAEHIANLPPFFRKLETYEFMNRQILMTQKRFGHFWRPQTY